MNLKFYYIGLFFDFDVFRSAVASLRRNPLSSDIKYPHVTFEYKPEEVDTSLFGNVLKIKIVGYGNDGKNEGVKVELSSDEPALQTLIEKISVPHITIALSDGAQAVNTKYIEFEPVEAIELYGTYGGFAEEGKPVLNI